MKFTIDNAINAIRKMVGCHFKTVESFNGSGEYYCLIDNDHENIEQFMREMTKLFTELFKEGIIMEKATTSRKHEGWINIYTMGNPKESFTGQTIYESEEAAKKGSEPCCATTIKIEWEE